MQRFEIISLIDVDFAADELNARDLEQLRRCSTGAGPLIKGFATSYKWVFNWNNQSENSLAGTQRFSLHSLATEKGLKDAVLLVAPSFGVGILSLYHASPEIDDFNKAIQRKQSANSESWELAQAMLDSIGIPYNELERQYPIAVVQLSGTINEFFASRETQLRTARLYTGNFEQEREEALLEYIKSGDLSRRTYERFYLRWTDALVIYDEGVGLDFEAAFLRCVLIYETCVLMRRMLRSAIQRMRRLASAMNLLPHPRTFSRLTESVARIRADFINSPPVQSEEAQRMLAGAYQGFGIYRLADSSAEQSKLLEARFQWAKAQVLGALAVVTYLMDRLGVFKWLQSLHLHF